MKCQFSPTPETLLLERLNRAQLQTAIDQLPVYFREILPLCEVEECRIRRFLKRFRFR